MPTTYAQLKAMLDVDEPDYAALAESVSGAMKHLRKMAASADTSLASKAVSLAGIIGDDDSVGVVADAAKSRNTMVRVAAAHAAALLPDSASAARVISKLLDDKDVGVVKFAARAIGRQSDAALAAKSRRAAARVAALARAAAKDNERRERSAIAASRKSKKSTAMPTTRSPVKRAAASKASAGGMPLGAMANPAKGKAAGDMPNGKMD